MSEFIRARKPGAIDPFDFLGLCISAVIETANYVFDRQDFFGILKQKHLPNLTRSQYTTTLHRLKRSGYVEFDSKQSSSIRFTTKARIRVLEAEIERMPYENHNRFISFDIPEDLSRSRDGFRRAIKRMGFKQIQRSLWAVNKNVGEIVELAAREYGVEKYVAYIIAERSDIDGYIEKIFAKGDSSKGAS